MKPACALPPAIGGAMADHPQKMRCAPNARKNQAYVMARSLMAALYRRAYLKGGDEEAVWVAVAGGAPRPPPSLSPLSHHSTHAPGTPAQR